MSKKVILNITPQTHVRATQGDSIFFRIPREKLRPAGLSRLLRLEKYNKYKKLNSLNSKFLFGGRLAEYKYYDMHQVIAAALTKTKNID